jgi:hypothetical protein
MGIGEGDMIMCVFGEFLIILGRSGRRSLAGSALAVVLVALLTLLLAMLRGRLSLTTDALAS